MAALAVAPYLGLWRLDPEASEYGDTPKPSRGIYTVLGDAERLRFFARWTLGEQTASVAFDAIPDGRLHPLPQDPSSTLTTTIDDEGLHSVVAKGDVELHRARRTIVDGGMEIHQALRGEDGWTAFSAMYRPAKTKQVLLYRRDLKMRKGKIAAQCAHASLAVFFRRDQGEDGALSIPLDGPMEIWSRRGFAKVVLSVETEEDLLAAHERATAMQLPTTLITDSGRTEFGGVPTRTTVAIGPAEVEEIDSITGPDGAVATKLA